MWLGIATHSPSMKKDAACSLCGATLSLGVCVGAAVVGADAQIWFIDALVALLVSLGLLVYGLLVLFKNKTQGNRWWQLAFWRSPTPAPRELGVHLSGGIQGASQHPASLAGDAHMPIEGERSATSVQGLRHESVESV